MQSIFLCNFEIALSDSNRHASRGCMEFKLPLESMGKHGQCRVFPKLPETQSLRDE